MLICVRIKQVKYILGNDFDFNQEAARYLTTIMKFQHMRLASLCSSCGPEIRKRNKIVPATEKDGRKILKARKDSSKYNKLNKRQR